MCLCFFYLLYRSLLNCHGRKLENTLRMIYVTRILLTVTMLVNTQHLISNALLFSRKEKLNMIDLSETN